MSLKTFAVFNDVHLKVHCRGAVKLLFEVLGDIKPDEIYINGDLLDAYNLNFYGPKHPEIHFNIEDEIFSAIEFFKKIKELCPESRIVFNAGNHETRLERFAIKNCAAFFQRFKIETMLQLESLDIEYNKYQEVVQVGGANLRMQHSPPSYSENGAKASLLKKPGSSWIFSCSHRVQVASIRDSHGDEHYCWFNGWLGSTTETEDHKIVFEYVKGHENWQKTFGFGYHDGVHFGYDQAKINQDGNKFSAMVFGNLYEVEV